MCYGRLRTQTNNKTPKRRRKVTTMSLNTMHNVSLTEGQISTILYTMEGYMQGSDDNEDSQFQQDVDDIFEILETVIDKYYAKIEKAKSKQPTPDW